MNAPSTSALASFDAVLGWLECDGRVLLVRNDRLEGDDLASRWDLPGGRLHPGESLVDALVREWKEETRLEVVPQQLCLTVDGRRTRGESTLYAWRAFTFRVDVNDSAEPEAGEGIDEVCWVALADVPRYLDAPYHAALCRWITDRTITYDTVTWSEDASSTLRSKLFYLLRIAALAATGLLDELRVAMQHARASGCGAARLEETLLQLVPYAGVPRTLAAFTVLRSVDSHVASQAIGDVARGERAEQGRGVFERVYGDRADAILETIRTLHPTLPAWILEDAYGRVLAREGGLSLVERELLAVSVLGSLGSLEAPLLGHMRAAVRLGASKDDVADAVTCIPLTLGPERSRAARKLLLRV